MTATIENEIYKFHLLNELITLREKEKIDSTRELMNWFNIFFIKNRIPQQAYVSQIAKKSFEEKKVIKEILMDFGNKKERIEVFLSKTFK